MKSVIYNLSRDDFESLVKKSNSLIDILRYFNLVSSKGNYGTLKKRLKEDGIDYSHIQLGIGKHFTGIRFGKDAIPLEEVLIENSTYSRKALKDRLIKTGMLKEICGNCEMLPEWDGKKLILILDHVNGINNDNRIENLRLLCPNCNSQTETFSGRNQGKRKTIKHCFDCGIIIGSKAMRCNVCRFKKTFKDGLTNRPSYDTLIKETDEMGFVEVGKKYGVTDNCIRKWIKKYEKYGALA